MPVLVGFLIVVAMAAGLMAYAFTGSLLVDPRGLMDLAIHGGRVGVATALLLVRAGALAMIPVVLFAMLRRQNRALALLYTLLRSVLESITYVVMAISWLSLLSLSRDAVRSAAVNLVSLQASGAWWLRVYSWAVTSNVIVFSFGAIILYSLLLRARLAPRWISVWGLVVIPLHLVMDLLCMFGLARDNSASHGLMNLAVFLQEIALALWILVAAARIRYGKRTFRNGTRSQRSCPSHAADDAGR